MAGTTARTAAELAGVNRNTARLFYHRLRTIIARHVVQSYPLARELEIDEAFLGSTLEQEQGRGKAGKTPVFGLLRRGNKIHTVMVAAAARESSPGPKVSVRPDSIFYADAPDIPQALNVSGFRHERIGERAARSRAQINSIENFWSQTKRQLRRYGGIPRRHLRLFLKECEWRFNHGSPKQLLRLLKSWVRTRLRRARSMPPRSAQR